MASTEPLIAPGEEDQAGGKRRVLKVACGCFWGVALTWFVLAWALQGLIYAWATSLSGCRPGALQGYNYDGDAGDQEDPTFNLVPRLSLLTERSPKWYGMAFYNFPANEASKLAGGQVGTWWRTWGPFFWTYTYEDMSSKTIIYMRQNLLRIGNSHRIARCDGKGPYVTFTEGSNWLTNRVRTVLGYNQAMNFKLYDGDDQVAFVQESNGEVPSLTFRNLDNDFMGTAVLLDPEFHGTKEQWLVKSKNETMVMPYWVPSAITLLFSFHSIHLLEARADQAPAAMAALPSKATTAASAGFLAGNATVAAATPQVTAAVAAPQATKQAVAAAAAAPRATKQAAGEASQAERREAEHI